MTTECERLAEQIHRAYFDGGWIEVSIHDLFYSLTATEAAAHPITGAHSAWEIALHLSFWHDAVSRRLGGETVEYADAEDWQFPPETTESNWQAALGELNRDLGTLVAAVKAMKPEQLDLLVPARTFTYYVMLHGVTQHDLYHAGQVMVLRKAIRGAARGAGAITDNKATC